MINFVNSLTELSKESRSFCVVTLVGKRGSVPQEVGAKMIVTPECENSPFFGTVGGGRVELHAIKKAKELIASGNGPEMITINLGTDLGMVCGGEVTLFFEATRKSKWVIAIFGAGHVSQALVQTLVNLDCEMMVFDEREEWLKRLPTSYKIKKHLIKDLEEDVKSIPSDAFVLTLSHGHLFDHRYLRAVLKISDRPYVGAIGSQKKAKELKTALLQDGIDEKVVVKIRSPIGLKIGTNDPFEIAISIVAELLENRDAFGSVKC